MEIKKGLSFSQAKENIKECQIFFFGIILGGIVIIIALAIFAEKRFLSERLAIRMAQGIFLGVAVALWKIIKGDSKKK